jgi:DNA (cytosine-5)-methyltransferase 1
MDPMILPRSERLSTRPRRRVSGSPESGTVVGLFAGIGGIEVGLHASGFRSTLLCDVDPASQRVLSSHFPDCTLVGDIRELVHVPPAEVLAAGFPCQDLSQAGQTAGITGKQSGLVGHVFRLLEIGLTRWLVLENVPFMLQLDRGKAMAHLATELERLGLVWAYRVIDTRSFGLPQRRLRVILVASATEDPRQVLFADEAEPREFGSRKGLAYGFYWTEGTRGLGWGVNAVPTLKGGSTIGIPSPPAVWMPDGRIVTPDVRDAERLQGFPVDWTLPAVAGSQPVRPGVRWKLVGNAVSVPVAAWIGKRLGEPGTFDRARNRPMPYEGAWPHAAWGRRGERHAVAISTWPRRDRYHDLSRFLKFKSTPLSAKATAGFLGRARASTLRFEEGFLESLEAHLQGLRADLRPSRSGRA